MAKKTEFPQEFEFIVNSQGGPCEGGETHISYKVNKTEYKEIVEYYKRTNDSTLYIDDENSKLLNKLIDNLFETAREFERNEYDNEEADDLYFSSVEIPSEIIESVDDENS